MKTLEQLKTELEEARRAYHAALMAAYKARTRVNPLLY